MKRVVLVGGLVSLAGLAACDSRLNSPTESAAAVRSGKTANQTVSNAVMTVVNNDVDGEHCLNGAPNPENCNLYEGKQYVWLGGEKLHGGGGLPNGTYVFAVLQPGGQGEPVDGNDHNLSDLDPTTHTGAGDAYTNRTFTLTDGVIGYTGTHDFDATHNKIRLFPYDDTPNNGDEYIMAVCAITDGNVSVEPSDCKYDAFKVRTAPLPPPPTNEALALTASKTAVGAYNNTFKWSIAKSVDQSYVRQMGGTSATFNYTVSASHDGGTVSNVKVSGDISVTNPNTAAVAITSISDVLSDGTPCSVTGTPATLAMGTTTLHYTCDLAALPSAPLDNTVTVTWGEQNFTDADAKAWHLAAGSATASVAGIVFTATLIDASAVITDSFTGTLGTLTSDSPSPSTFTYARTITVASNVCTTYPNTASFQTNTTGAAGSASRSVTACGNVAGGLTIGYWQNKNGQSIITNGGATAGVCNSATWLRQYAPFADLSATATCANVASYAMTIIKAANASGSSMNAMLKAQMLATAFDVYFSSAALGGNKIGAPVAVGGVKVDLTAVCSVISACAGNYISTSGAFGGATSMTVAQLLTYAASQSDAGGITWYGQVKAVQELAKDTFDAINNAVAFTAP